MRTHCQVRVLQRLSNLDSSLRTKRQTLLQKIYRERARIGEQRPKGLFLAEWEGANIFTRALGGDRVEVVDGGGTKDVKDYGKLVVIYGAQKDRSEIWRFLHSNKGGHSQSRPGKRGFPLNISARTQPTLHISIARVYSLNVSMTSGARYHLQRVTRAKISSVHRKFKEIAR